MVEVAHDRDAAGCGRNSGGAPRGARAGAEHRRDARQGQQVGRFELLPPLPRLGVGCRAEGRVYPVVNGRRPPGELEQAAHRGFGAIVQQRADADTGAGRDVKHRAGSAVGGQRGHEGGVVPEHRQPARRVELRAAGVAPHVRRRRRLVAQQGLAEAHGGDGAARPAEESCRRGGGVAHHGRSCETGWEELLRVRCWHGMPHGRGGVAMIDGQARVKLIRVRTHRGHDQWPAAGGSIGGSRDRDAIR